MQRQIPRVLEGIINSVAFAGVNDKERAHKVLGVRRNFHMIAKHELALGHSFDHILVRVSVKRVLCGNKIPSKEYHVKNTFPSKGHFVGKRNSVKGVLCMEE